MLGFQYGKLVSAIFVIHGNSPAQVLFDIYAECGHQKLC